MRAFLPLALLLAVVGCAPRVVIPNAEREKISAEVEGKARYLRVAMYAAPFFGDRSKLLLSDAPLRELDLVETGDGTPILPPPAEKILPPGTPVVVDRVEFPTAWRIASRVVMTPRYDPWAYLTVRGDARPYVFVLSSLDANASDVRIELDRVLTSDDPSGALAALPQEQRDAILKKQLVEGMSTRAVEMAWGVPEKKLIDRPASTEQWTWPGGKRRASFQDDRLVRWEPR